MTLPQTTIGIDISSRRLDAYLHPAAKARSFTNDAAGIAALIGWTVGHGAFVVLEATAPWDQPLLRVLERAGLAFHRANPRRARDFARSAGMLAKTDTVDARMLALYGAALDLPATAPVDPERLKLQSLNSRRDQMVETLRAQPVGQRERPVEVLRVEPAGQRRHLVDDSVRLGPGHRLTDGGAVQPVDDHRDRP